MHSIHAALAEMISEVGQANIYKAADDNVSRKPCNQQQTEGNGHSTA
jgi:hypothetical protein